MKRSTRSSATTPPNEHHSSANGSPHKTSTPGAEKQRFKDDGSFNGQILSPDKIDGYLANLVNSNNPTSANNGTKDHSRESTKSRHDSKQEPILWGRHYQSTTWLESVKTFTTTLAILTCCPLLVVYYWSSCAHFKCSLTEPALYIQNHGIAPFYTKYFPKFDANILGVLLAWYVFQGALYVFLPGPETRGQLTPAGIIPKYWINGLWAWCISHVLFAGLVWYYGLPALTYIADRWGSFLVACNILAYALSAFCYVKALYWPTHLEDRKFSGSRLYDFYMGIELNPRLGEWFDFKLFHNGRPGIVAWTLINLSFAGYQYRKFGAVSNSMFLVLLLQGLYAFDLFYNEDWYLRTLDIAHDHFGFYLAWGDLVWLPFMYTLQCYYLSRHFVELGTFAFLILFHLGLLGYYIFRTTNNQKDKFRQQHQRGVTPKVEYTFFESRAKPASYIPVMYKTSDGKKHSSALLTSGFWGVARHFNYTGDLLLAACMSGACGNPVDHFYPYFHLIFMIILLINRIYRDEQRCSLKYGKYWQDYCKQVPYRLIPYVY